MMQYKLNWIDTLCYTFSVHKLKKREDQFYQYNMKVVHVLSLTVNSILTPTKLIDFSTDK